MTQDANFVQVITSTNLPYMSFVIVKQLVRCGSRLVAQLMLQNSEWETSSNGSSATSRYKFEITYLPNFGLLTSPLWFGGYRDGGIV